MREIRDFYLLLHPRPAYAIGSGKYPEIVNFMAASWVTPIAEDPPRLAVAIGVESYTHKLINKYNEFTVNILSAKYLDELYYIGTVTGRTIDKVSKVKMKAVKGRIVDAPILEEAVGVIECKVAGKYESEDTTLFIGDVQVAYADEKAFKVRTGWDFKSMNIPLHNWGRGFYKVGHFMLAKSSH